MILPPLRNRKKRGHWHKLAPLFFHQPFFQLEGQKSTGSRDAKSTKRTKGKAAGSASAQQVPDAGAAEGRDTENVLTNAAAYTATLAKAVSGRAS